MTQVWDSLRPELLQRKKGGRDVIYHGCNKKGHYISECYKTPDADKERILKIKTQVWNDKKKKGVAAVEVEAEGENNDNWKEDLPDHNTALHLLGYKNLNVRSVEDEQESNDILEIDDFEGDNIKESGSVQVTGVTRDKSEKLDESMRTKEMMYILTATQLPIDSNQTKFPVKGIATWAAIKSVV